VAIATAEAAATVKTVTLLEQDPGSSPGFFLFQNHRFWNNRGVAEGEDPSLKHVTGVASGEDEYELS